MKTMKTKMAKKILTVLAGFIMIMTEIAGDEVSLQVQAADAPVVSELKVASSDDGTGVVAQCSYQNYNDQSGCELTLYLYRAEENGANTIVAYQTLPYAVSEIGSIDAGAVGEGTYFASVVMDYSGTINPINSQYYKVKLADGGYIVTPEKNDMSADHKNNSGNEKEQKSGKPDCIHVWEYNIIEQATAEKDSVMAYQCAKCGQVIEYLEVPNSAYCVFLSEAAETIRSAQTDQVIIDTQRWISFDQKVLDAIADRRDVTIVVNYKYQGKKYSVTIPGGADVSGLADENGFCGFRYLDLVFGGKEVTLVHMEKLV